MRRSSTIAVAALLVVGCGRPLLGDLADSGGGTVATTGSGDGGTGANDAIADTSGPTPLDVADSGPVTSGPVAEDGVPPPLPSCFITTVLFEAPGDVPIFPQDQDSDGRDELWALQNTGGNGPGGGPPQTTIYGIDGNGEVLSETMLAGRVFKLVDGNGDGFDDLLFAEFGPGGPQISFVLSDGPASFNGPMIPIELDFGNPIAGLIDATGDGIMDVVYLVDNATIELQQGDGMGGFTVVSDYDFPAPGLVAFPIDGASPMEPLIGLRSVAPQMMMGPPPPCEQSEYATVTVLGGMINPHASTEGTAYGPMLRANTGVDGDTILFTDDCDPVAGTHGALVLASLPENPAVYAPYSLLDTEAWVGVADFDGGYPDVMWADPGSDQVRWAQGLDPVSIDASQPADGISGTDVDPNHMMSADFDGTGLESLIRGVIVDPGDPPRLSYERIQLGPC